MGYPQHDQEWRNTMEITPMTNRELGYALASDMLIIKEDK